MSSDATGSMGFTFTFSNFCNVVHGKIDGYEHRRLMPMRKTTKRMKMTNVNDGRPEKYLVCAAAECRIGEAGCGGI